MACILPKHQSQRLKASYSWAKVTVLREAYAEILACKEDLLSHLDVTQLVLAAAVAAVGIVVVTG